MLEALEPFRGLDKNPGASDGNGYLAECLNLIIRADHSAARRPALKYRINLPADSVGLYSVGDSLRTSAPFNAGDLAGDDYLSPTITVDYITDPGQAYTVLGTAADSSGATFLQIVKADLGNELHHCPGTSLQPAVSTLLAPGFTPAFSLIMATGRLWTLNANLRLLNYSTVESGTPANLENFTAGSLNNSAGSLSIGNYSAGSGNPTALASYGERVVVFYLGRILLYRVDEDQNRIYLESSKQGPGTRYPRSIAELSDDLIFFSEAGVRTLTTATRGSDTREDAVGGKIDTLAKTLAAPVLMQPIGHISRRLGCYLLSFGQDVLCLSVLPGQAVLGWSQWRFPIPIDGFAESGGITWVRSGASLFSLDETLNQDQTSISGVADIPIRLETLPNTSAYMRMCATVAASCIEPIQIQVIADGRPGVDINGAPLGMPITLPARSPEPTRATVGKWGRTFSIRVYDAAAQANWRLDGLWMDLGQARRT